MVKYFNIVCNIYRIRGFVLETKGKLVLIADDDERNRVLLEAMLNPLGLKIVKAKDGQEAYEKAINVHPDIILLDIMMPQMDGLESLALLKTNEQTSNIPVVMVTALRDVEDRVKALETGADDFLSKPVDKTELRARVISLLKVKEYNDYMRNYQKKLEAEVESRTRDLKNALNQIRNSSLQTIYILSKAAEYKDEDTGAHVQRMSNYSAAIAKTLGFNGDSVERILYASSMHDVGKIGIPDIVLLKPDKLIGSEWTVMKKHAQIGADILAGSDNGFLRMAQIIAETHHEKWDGSGYPKGLEGKQIPLIGRVVAVADVFDALISKRPYKDPFPLEKAFEILRESSGSHFDPKVVDAFFKSKETILNIKNKYQDDEPSKFVAIKNELNN